MAQDRTVAEQVGPAIGISASLQPTHSAGVGALLFPTEHYTVHGAPIPTQYEGAAYHVVPLLPGQNYLVGRNAPSMPVPQGSRAIPIDMRREGANQALSRGQFRVETIEDRVSGKTAFAIRHSVSGNVSRLAYDALIDGSDGQRRAALTANNIAAELRDGDRITFSDHANMAGQPESYFKSASILYREDFIDARGNIVAGMPFAQRPLDVRQLPEGLLVLHFKGDAADRIDTVLANNDRMRPRDGLPLYLRPNRSITLSEGLVTSGLVVDLAQVFADPRMEYAVIGVGANMGAVAQSIGDFTEQRTGRAASVAGAVSRDSTMAVGAAAEAAMICSDMLIMAPRTNGTPMTGIEPVEGLLLVHRQGAVTYIPHGRASEQGASTALYFPSAGDGKNNMHLQTGSEAPIASGSAILPGMSPKDLELKKSGALKPDMRNLLIFRNHPFDFGALPQATEAPPAPTTPEMDPEQARKFLEGILNS